MRSGCPAKPECVMVSCGVASGEEDRKSTRLNSSHSQISYAVFCLKKKNRHLAATAEPQVAVLGQERGAVLFLKDGGILNQLPNHQVRGGKHHYTRPARVCAHELPQ